MEQVMVEHISTILERHWILNGNNRSRMDKMSNKANQVTDALGNSYTLVIAGNKREYDDFLKATGHDAETYPYVSEPDKAFGYYGVKDVLFIGSWYKRDDAADLLKAAESVKTHAEWIEKEYAAEEADSYQQVSNEELLEAALNLTQPPRVEGDRDASKTNNLKSIAISLLVIARKMSEEDEK